MIGGAGYGQRAERAAERAPEQRHPFSLAPARPVRPLPAEPTGWRAAFGDLWIELAITSTPDPHRASCRSHDRLGAGAELIRAANAELRRLLGGSRPDHRCALLRCAATVLEGCALVWEHAGPAGGQRHLHLLRRLEERLARAERDARSGEIPRRVDPAVAANAGLAAARALRLLEGSTGDRARALAALEDAAVRAAGLAVRAAIDPHTSAASRPAPRDPPSDLVTELHAIGLEVVATAARRSQGTAGGPGAWLVQALRVPVPRDAIALAADPRADRALRAESLLAVRWRWVALGSALVVVVARLDDLSAARTYPRDTTLARAAAREAATALHAAHLTDNFAPFDHATAWAHQRTVLLDTAARLIDGPSENDDAPRLAQQRLIERLGKAIAAIHAADRQLGRPPHATTGTARDG